MDLTKELPPEVARLIRVHSFAEFATVSSEGVPIDTPLLNFPADDLSRITMATGLSYPAKAERARRNPKVGLLYRSDFPGEPVVQVTGMAAVRDSDIDANIREYLSQTGYVAPELPWELKRKAIWYWARILIDIYPVEVTWWDNVDSLDQPPKRWRVPEGATFPPSAPAPAGPRTAAPKWAQPPWQTAAFSDVERGYPAYVTLLDEDGFPRVMKAEQVRFTDDAFRFVLPETAPGRREGTATLTYFGRDTFVGTLERDGGDLVLRVARALPILPLVEGNAFDPAPEVKDALMGRLTAELDRRGLPMPTVPLDMPALTANAKLREQRDTKGADEKMFER